MTRFQLASHHNDQLQARGDGHPPVEGIVSDIMAAVEQGDRVVVEHLVDRNSYRQLPDFVRWVDDTLTGIAGLHLSGSEDLKARKDFPTWWRAAIETAVSRELGLEIAPGLPFSPGPGLRSIERAETKEPHPELITSWPRGEETPEAQAQTLSLLMAGVGTLARFVNVERLIIEDPRVLAYVNEDPRDRRRYQRHQRGDLCTRVEVSPGVNKALVASVVRAVEALDSEVTLVESGEHASVKEGEQISARIVIGTATRSDYQTMVEQTLAHWPKATQTEAFEALGADWAREEPPCTWSPALDADLWLIDVPELDVVVASSDAVVVDHFLATALDVNPGEVAWLDHARQAQSPWLAHEAVMPGGKLPVAVVNRPRVKRAPKPLTILGLACTTLANHSAVIIRDGEVVTAIQEERLRRRKQLGWHPPGRPGVTVVADPTLTLESAWPKRALDVALKTAGITMEDVDFIAYNGIPARYFPTYSLTEVDEPPRTIFDGKNFFVPHHLTHAASAFRVSGFEGGYAFTVDGRGERETAAFFDINEGHIERVFDVRVLKDSLIGGVYEYITTILGFGHHGAGSTMGLAPYGTPNVDLSSFLSARDRSDYAIHDRGIEAYLGHLRRQRHAPMSDAHRDLAASAQLALEETVLTFIRDGLAGRTPKELCLAGGVALNCAMNQRIRTELGVEKIFVQPAANDAGTALGAAAEAFWELTGEQLPPMTHAYLGPAFTDAEQRDTLRAFGLRAEQPADMAQAVAERLASGKVVAWFQGGLEFGPRALGARSILADPRTQAMADRVNALKQRQRWRPFGPSILAGHEADWFDTAFESPFMLFTLPVKPEKRSKIEAVVHVDGTTRPQSVRPEVSPLYHAVIEAFYRMTGVPMVLNTSFNTAFEPIVCTPADAVTSFLHLGADCLAMGPYLVDRRSSR